MIEMQAHKIIFNFPKDRYFRLPSDAFGALFGELALERKKAEKRNHASKKHSIEILLDSQYPKGIS